MYFQAGLKSVGHFQAKGLMGACHKLVESVNWHLAIPSGGSGSEDEDEMEWEERVWHVVVGVGSQGYNAVMHHTHSVGGHP